jgi:pimeloyl-ACP methyl ester carboxylesterase
MQLIFLHGAASGPEIWSRQRRHYPRALYFTYPKTDADPVSLLGVYADAVLAMMRPPTIIIGHSLGGAVAELCAARIKTGLAGLVLVGTGPRLPVNPELLAGLIHHPSDTLQQVARWSLAKGAPGPLVDRSEELARAAEPALAYRQFAACGHFDLTGEAPLPHSTAIIWGAQDRMTPPPLIRELFPLFPHHTTDEIPDAGHLVMLEQPDAFNRALAGALKRFGCKPGAD